MTYRVVQWTTGNVGVKSVHAIIENSLLELVGCYAWSPDKVGRDVGDWALLRDQPALAMRRGRGDDAAFAVDV